MIRRILPFVFLGFIALEFYVFQAVKNLSTSKTLRIGYWVFTAILYASFIGLMLAQNSSSKNNTTMGWFTSLFAIFLIPKLLVAFILLFDDLFRGAEYVFNLAKQQHATYPSRRKFMSTTALALGGLLSYSFFDGIFWGKYRYFVRTVRLKIPGLPANFKGYKVLQISDVHSGSFSSPDKLQKAIDMINAQNADLVLFTGDMVNSYADEFVPFVQLFSTIKSKDGKFTIMGNHDYGSYGRFNTESARAENISKLIQLEKEAGFEMLRNEHRVISRNGEKLYIIGVENWGLPPFPQYGDLDKAAKGIPPEAAKILMSHDPTHFDEIVKHHPSNVQLTLSGHTHGMQFGLDLKNVKWSPSEYKYPKWIDLYESMGKYLYVNRGFGVIGYLGRVGIKPEITVFELS